jgi:hypothetical protein
MMGLAIRVATSVLYGADRTAPGAGFEDRAVPAAGLKFADLLPSFAE